MIKLLRTRQEMIRFSSQNQRSIGLVPTMGNLHEGHLSLVQKSINDNESTIVSIFVNPKQFGEGEDFEKYPRTLDDDIKKLEFLNSSDKELIVFAPHSIEDIYPSGFDTTISVKGLDSCLCGNSRPGHFDGVCTVVYQLFKLTLANNAYFGLKDFQQTLIIRKMLSDLLIPINIHLVEIKRDSDGLALSSRNQYLSKEQRHNALTLPQRLNKLKELIVENQLEQAQLLKNEFSNDKNVDYFEILDSSTLSQINNKTKEVVIAGAMFFGTTRLIDNILVKINA